MQNSSLQESESETRIDLSVLIVNWNTRALLRNCLESVYSTITNLSFEVIVVDNASADGSPDMVATEFPDVRLLRNANNLGFATANNQAINCSRGCFVLLLNSDAVVEPHSVERLVEFLDQNEHVGALGGLLRNPDGTFQSSFADFPGLLHELLMLTGVSRWVFPPSYPSYPEAKSLRAQEVDWVGGAYMMVRRATIDAIGGLDEDYFMYAEEMDWCFRIKRGGWQVWYLPEAVAQHWSGGSSRRVPERRRAQLYSSKWLFLSKHAGPTKALVFRYMVRATSVAKLWGWSLAGIVANARTREHARQHVAAYRYLLATF